MVFNVSNNIKINNNLFLSLKSSLNSIIIVIKEKANIPYKYLNVPGADLNIKNVKQVAGINRR